MSKPLLIVHTNPTTGRAEVSLGDRSVIEPHIQTAKFEPIAKKPNEAAAPHHPGTLMYLRVLEGSHIVIVPTADAKSVELLVLEAGDDIVFADLASTAKPPAAPVSFTGHASQAGKHGNRFERCPLPLSLPDLHPKSR